ncbi:restriction endonuclease subunit S [Gilvimarinus xylanilyticus]|uniref:Restriction endonuclease subunit S n=1 Tax=Gilvimarinus xylanilyticus TaxID=2944139 RepID=A0A9X2HV31_9GAMM|nr:restriction endonuclease subunit S [Gilvimarinus xylanilyticus]MCP8898968.1 restriction endonuclease subunit S [Gilvimarinus xylanilyticus]
MEAALKNQIGGLNLNRSDWRLVKFGDVAIQQKKTVDRENTDLTRYVKGEHMYSEDLHLREWGELQDEYLGPAFIRKFEEGDILYGSRRTYLRKVAIAPFDGITSNTTFVVKANEELIDRDLLPFIMLSEGFSQHSIRNSKGSVNPYVNWKDLASYEFLLPPKDWHKEIIEIFAEADRYRELTKVVCGKAKSVLRTILEEKVTNLNEKGFSRACLRDLIQIKHGFPFKSEYWSDDDGQLPIVVTIGNYDYEGGFRFFDTKIKCYSGDYPEDYKLNPGDLLLAMTCQTPGGEILGIPGIIEDKDRLYLHNQRMGKVEVINKNIVTLEYLYLLFLTDDFRRFLFSSASGTKVLHTSPSKISEYEFFLPPLAYQQSVVNEYKQVEKVVRGALSLENNQGHMFKSLVNQVF